MRIAFLALLLIGCAVPETDQISCSKLTAVDGDTIKCDGELMRLIGSGEPFVSGFNTGELRTYKCQAEKTAAQAAHRRLKALLPGSTVIYTGQRDRTQARRPLVRLQLADGRYAGDVLIAEGLAQEWPDGPGWC